MDANTKLNECRRILKDRAINECSGDIRQFSQAGGPPPKGSMVPPAEVAAFRNHVAERTQRIGKMLARAVYVGTQNEWEENPREAWNRTGKKAHGALARVESLLDQIEQVIKEAS